MAGAMSASYATYNRFQQVDVTTSLYSRTTDMTFALKRLIRRDRVLCISVVKQILGGVLSTEIGTSSVRCNIDSNSYNLLAKQMHKVARRLRRCNITAWWNHRVKSTKLEPVSHQRMVEILTCWLMRILPPNILLTESIKSNIKKVTTLGRFDKLCLFHLLECHETKKLQWLKLVRRDLRWVFMAKLVVWIVRRLILDVIKTFFYATETSSSYKINYFYKPIWQKKTESYFKSCLQDGTFRTLYSQTDRIRKTLRLMIKSDGSFRPLVIHNLSFSERINRLYINAVLHHLLHGMQFYELISSPNDITDKWIRLKEQVKSGSDKVFFVKVDIQNAFASVQYEQLLGMLNTILLKAEVSELSLRLSKSGKYSVTFDKAAACVTVVLADLYVQLAQILCDRRLRYGKRFLVCENGILQGDVLSPVLCDLYYGLVLRHIFPDFFDLSLISYPYLMFRRVDDIVLVTTHKHTAMDFLHRMEKGCPKYQCFLNHSKTVTNLENSLETKFVFFGSVFDVFSFEVIADVSPYKSVDMQHTFRLVNYKNPGFQLLKKIRYFTGISNYSIYWDPRINSKHTLLKSMYSFIQLLSRRCLSLISKLNMNRDDRNPTFIAKSILVLVKSLHKRFRRHAERGNYTVAFKRMQLVRMVIMSFLFRLPKDKFILRREIRRVSKAISWTDL